MDRSKKPKRSESDVIAQHRRQTFEYMLGRDAYLDGKAMDDCPYVTEVQGATSEYRICWMIGFLDARTYDRLWKSFDRLGITWERY